MRRGWNGSWLSWRVLEEVRVRLRFIIVVISHIWTNKSSELENSTSEQNEEITHTPTCSEVYRVAKIIKQKLKYNVVHEYNKF